MKDLMNICQVTENGELFLVLICLFSIHYVSILLRYHYQVFSNLSTVPGFRNCYHQLSLNINIYDS
jgi:hypothetical protein